MSIDGAHAADVAAGALLVATPELRDPNFAGSVVLLLDVDDSGVLGVVLNRPSPMPVLDVLPAWAEVVSDPPVLFAGGPVQTDGALAVAVLAAPLERPSDLSLGRQPDSPDPTGGSAAPGLRPLGGRLALLDLDVPAGRLDVGLTGLRVFAGYAGWGAEQLVAEIEEGSWYVVSGRPDDVIAPDVHDLRRQVLRRQPGELAWLATRPLDPDQN